MLFPYWTFAVDFIHDGPLRRTMRALGTVAYDRTFGHSRPDWAALESTRASVQQRHGLAADQASTFDVQFDAPYISSIEPFAIMSHDEIHREVRHMSAQDAAASVALWRSAADIISSAGQEFIAGIRSVIGTEWTGPAAAAAEQGTTEFLLSVEALSRTAAFVAHSAETGSEGIHETTARMPEPASPSLAERSLSMVPYPGLFKAAQQRADEAEDYARDIMQTVYAPAMTSADSVVPLLAAPSDPTSHSGLPAGGSAGSSWQGANSDPDARRTYSPSAGVTVDGPAGQHYPGGTPAGSGQDEYSWRNNSPASVAPAGLDAVPPVRGDTPSSGPLTGNTGQGSPAPGRAGDGMPGAYVPTASRGAGGAPAPGRPAGGSLAGGSGRNTDAGRAATSPARTGTGTGSTTAQTGARGGMGAFAPMAGAAGKADEKDHETAKYLQSRRNGEDIIGRLRNVVPPVLGSSG